MSYIWREDRYCRGSDPTTSHPHNYSRLLLATLTQTFGTFFLVTTYLDEMFLPLPKLLVFNCTLMYDLYVTFSKHLCLFYAY